MKVLFGRCSFPAGVVDIRVLARASITAEEVSRFEEKVGMSAPTRHHRNRQRERAELDRIARQLGQRFPAVPPERIAAAIDDRYRELEDSRIRDFVPVLIERAVRAELGRS